MNNLNILIVEDESLVALELADTITNYGYNVVEYATNKEMAREFIKDDTINLILMDINLGDVIDGIDLYKSFSIDTPVIYITAYKDEKNISRAIETNPIGYLIKPLNEDELKAILILASYKNNNKTTKIDKDMMIDIGEDYYFDDKTNKLFHLHVEVKLTNKEITLLKLLIDSKDSIVDYRTIEYKIWGEKTVSDSALRTLIYRLRGKLNYKLIKNSFKEGIQL